MSASRTGEELARPRQVTVAGWMIVIGSVGVVLSVFSQVGSLNSLDTTRALEEALAQPPAAGLDVSVGDARLALRISAMVAGACAAAAAILGWQVLQRSRSARLALAVLALPLFVTGVASGGLLSSIVVASAVMLWLQPARDWFAGRAPVRAPAALPSPPGSIPDPPPPAGADPGPSPAAGPHSEPTSAGAWRHVGPTGSLPPGASGPAGARRPVQVVWACIVTWAMTGLVAGLMALSVVVLVAAPGEVLDEITRQNPELSAQGLTVEDVRLAALVLSGVLVAWCVVAAVLAGLVWRGRVWAQVALVVSACAAALLCLLATLLNPLLVVPLVACVACVVLLLRAETRWWLRVTARDGRA